MCQALCLALSCELAHLNSSTSPGEDIIRPILQRYTLKLREALYLAQTFCQEVLGLKVQPSKELSSHYHAGHVNKVKQGKDNQPNQKNQNKQNQAKGKCIWCLIPMGVPLFLGVGSQELFRGVVLYPVKLGVGWGAVRKVGMTLAFPAPVPPAGETE